MHNLSIYALLGLSNDVQEVSYTKPNLSNPSPNPNPSLHNPNPSPSPKHISVPDSLLQQGVGEYEGGFGQKRWTVDHLKRFLYCFDCQSFVLI